MDTDNENEGNISLPRAHKVERIYASALLATAVAIAVGLLGLDELSVPLTFTSYVFAVFIPPSAVYVSSLFDDEFGILLRAHYWGGFLEFSSVGLMVGIACCFFHFGLSQGIIAVVSYIVATVMLLFPFWRLRQENTGAIESE